MDFNQRRYEKEILIKISIFVLTNPDFDSIKRNYERINLLIN